MKSVVQGVILSGSLTLMSAMLTPVLAINIGTQDFILFESIKIDTGNGITDISPELISTALGSPKESVTFPGGGVFTSTDKFPGLATNENLVISDNTTVTTGVYSLDGNNYLGLLISSDISKKPRNFGLSDLVQFNITSAFPNLTAGETGTLNASNFLFTIPLDTSEETDLTPLEVAVSRTKKGEFAFVSQDNSTLSQVYNLPFTIAEANSFPSEVSPLGLFGMSNIRLFGKGMFIVGSTVLGTAAGATVGAVTVPIVGSIPGSVAGAIGGSAVGIGQAIIENTDNAPDTPTKPPIDIQPPPGSATPVPWETDSLALIGSTVIFSLGLWSKQKLAQRRKDKKD